MLIRSKKSCFAAKCEEEGRAVVAGQGGMPAEQTTKVDSPLTMKQQRRPCTSIAFASLKCSESEDKNELHHHAHVSSSYDTACKMTVGGEQSADGTAYTTASTAIVEGHYYESFTPWRARSRSLSSVSSVSLPSVFSMDDEDMTNYQGNFNFDGQSKCWNVHSLLTDLLGELLAPFQKRCPPGADVTTAR